MIKKVYPGNQFSPNASEHNEMAEIINYFMRNGLPNTNVNQTGLPSMVVGLPPTETTYANYRVVAIECQVIDGVDDTTGDLDPASPFAKQVEYYISDVDPAADLTLGITQGTTMMNTAYDVMLSGVSRVKIDILDTGHRFATLKATQPTGDYDAQLESSETGGFEIVSQHLNTSGEKITGEGWCTVRFPVAQGGGEGTVQPDLCICLCNKGGKLLYGTWSYGDSVQYNDSGTLKYGYVNTQVTSSTTSVTVTFYDGSGSVTVAIGDLVQDASVAYDKVWYKIGTSGTPIRGLYI